MAWKPKKKHKPLSKEEQAYIKAKLDESKKFNKPIKGEIIYKVDGSSQCVVEVARYSSENEIMEDANAIVANMNDISGGKKKWILVSTRVVSKGDFAEDEDNIENGDH